MPTPTATDRNGSTVRVGTSVRVLSLRPEFIEGLPLAERSDVASMIGRVLEVYEIDEYGSAWVQESWRDGDEGERSHSIGLDADEMEIA